MAMEDQAVLAKLEKKLKKAKESGDEEAIAKFEKKLKKAQKKAAASPAEQTQDAMEVDATASGKKRKQGKGKEAAENGGSGMERC